MKKKIIKVLIAATLLSVASAFSANAITCGAGKSGHCFKYVERSTTIPSYGCAWTGMEADNCTLLGKVYRTIIDNSWWI